MCNMDQDERMSIERYGEIKGGQSVKSRVETAMDEAEEKAIRALGGYKFQMFGYWAAIWVHLNRVGGFNRPNPFRFAVEGARAYLPDYERPEFPVYHDTQSLPRTRYGGNEHAAF